MMLRKYTHILNFTLCILLMLILLIVIKFATASHSVGSETKKINDHVSSDKATNAYKDVNFAIVKNEQDSSKNVTATHEEIVKLTDQFMEILVQDINENYKVIAYQSKEELLEAFEEVTTKEVAKVYVDFYYEEKDDGLYIIPTETPPWFMEENPYDMVQLNNEQIKISQTNETVFYDAYSIEIELSFDEKWKITKITHL